MDVVSAQQRPSRRRPRPLKSHHNPAPTSLPGLPKYGILAALRGGSARAGESEGKRISQSKESPSASCFSRRPSPTCRALSLLTSPYYQPTRLVSHSRHTSFPTTSPRPSMTRVLCDRITIDLCPSLISAARPEAPAERPPPLPPRTASDPFVILVKGGREPRNICGRIDLLELQRAAYLAQMSHELDAHCVTYRPNGSGAH